MNSLKKPSYLTTLSFILLTLFQRERRFAMSQSSSKTFQISQALHYSWLNNYLISSSIHNKTSYSFNIKMIFLTSPRPSKPSLKKLSPTPWILKQLKLNKSLNKTILFYDVKLSRIFWRDFIPLKPFPSFSSPKFVISQHL